MADKITNFEDYKKREVGSDTDVDIQIEDPYNFFNQEEREEYFRERQKELNEKTVPEKKAEDIPHERPHEEPNARNHAKRPDRNASEKEPKDYDRQREDSEDYDDYREESEDEESEGRFPMELFVRVSSIITGVIILAFIAMILKVKVFDRYFIPNPDEEETVATVVALPTGYTEKDDTVVVTAQMLNLRTVDSSESDSTVITSVPKGTELKRVAVNSEGTWALIDYNGSRVYASMKYLEVKQ